MPKDSKHINQANRNRQFLKLVEDKFQDNFFDWKITILFYYVVHLLRAFAASKNIDIGESHDNLKFKLQIFVSKKCEKSFINIFRYCRTARYDGFTNHEVFNEICKDDLKECKKYAKIIVEYLKEQKFISENNKFHT